MEKERLPGLPLFQGMDVDETQAALAALHGRERNFERGESILHTGDLTRRLGLVLSGSVTIESADLWGNRTILSHVGQGQVFAETYALLGEPLLVDVVANEPCRVLFLELDPMRGDVGVSEAWRGKLLRNLLRISAQKNLHLSSRSFHTAPKTIRGRLLAYLNSVSIQHGSREFTIPFDRQQLADYLNVERSALSKEIGKLEREGVFQCRKSWFRLGVMGE